MHGVYRYANDFQLVIDLLSSGKLNSDKIISAEFKFDELVEAIEFANNPEQDKLKVMMRY